MSKVQNPQTLRGKVALWASVALVFLVAILLFLILVKPAGTTEPPNPVAAETTKATGECDVPEGDTSSKPAMPKDLRWEAEKGWTWPVSDTYGPTKTKDGYGVCFARSPLGAALMAVSLNATSNTTGLKEAIEIYVMESPGKGVYRSTLSEASKASTPVTYSGFIVDSFTPDEAQLTLVIATDKTATGYAGIPQTFRWVDGDWKLKVLDDGKLFAGQPVTPNAGEFVTWSDNRG